jgi:hypothetical protein
MDWDLSHISHLQFDGPHVPRVCNADNPREALGSSTKPRLDMQPAPDGTCIKFGHANGWRSQNDARQSFRSLRQSHCGLPLPHNFTTVQPVCMPGPGSLRNGKGPLWVVYPATL